MEQLRAAQVTASEMLCGAEATAAEATARLGALAAEASRASRGEAARVAGEAAGLRNEVATLKEKIRELESRGDEGDRPTRDASFGSWISRFEASAAEIEKAEAEARKYAEKVKS